MSRRVKTETNTEEREGTKGIVCPKTEEITKTDGSLI
jgi:hypothetical protein